MSHIFIAYSTNIKNQGDLTCCVIFVDAISVDVKRTAAGIMDAVVEIIMEQEMEILAAVVVTVVIIME